MAITFIEKRKRLRYLVFVFLAILVAIIIIVLWPNISGYLFGIKPLVLPPLGITEEKIEIDFEVLKHPLLEKLQLFPEIEPFTEEVGRENPFIFY
jgi:hypothetical protein